MTKKREQSRARPILAGLVTGAVLGVLANYGFGSSPKLESLITYGTDPLGQVFLRMMIMVVIPLVFASITLGVAGLGDLRKLGRIGLKTFLYFVVVTALSVGIGLICVNTFRPGEGLSPEIKEKLMERFGKETAQKREQAKTAAFGIGMVVAIVPRNVLASAVGNDMLGIIFFAIVFGIALTRIPAARREAVTTFLDGVNDAMIVMIGLAMKIAPLGVACLVFSVTARFGFDLFLKLGGFVLTTLLGLSIHQFAVFPILIAVLGGMNPWTFFKRIQEIMLTAFSTSSSSATLPTTMRIAEEELEIPKEITGFVIPLGATMNMNGTALFEGVAVLFLAQVFGVTMPLSTQLGVVMMSVLMAIGAAGVPGGSIPLLIIVLETVGIPGEGIALIIGVDRILDMCRTVLNVTGDVTAALYVARSEGMMKHLAQPEMTSRPE